MIARSGYGQTAPPLLPFSSPHQGEGDSFLAAAARPDPDRHASARCGAAQYPRVPGRPLCGGASGGYLARLGLGVAVFYLRITRAGSGRASSFLALSGCDRVLPPRASSCHGRAAAAVPSTGGLSDRYCPHRTPASSALPFPRSDRLWKFQIQPTNLRVLLWDSRPASRLHTHSTRPSWGNLTRHLYHCRSVYCSLF